MPTVVTRTLAGFALGLPVLLIAWLGTPAFEVMVAVAAGILAREWFGMTGSDQSARSGLLLCCVVVIARSPSPPASASRGALAALALGTALVVLATRGAPWMTLGALYIGLPCVALVWLRNDPAAGRDIVLWLLLVVWASDIGAYAAGRLIGGPKLARADQPEQDLGGIGRRHRRVGGDQRRFRRHAGRRACGHGGRSRGGSWRSWRSWVTWASRG